MFTPLQYMSLLGNLIAYSWKAYRYVRGKSEEIAYQESKLKLERAVETLKAAKSVKEKIDANKTILRDVIGRLRGK